jgi:hypothetical protein
VQPTYICTFCLASSTWQSNQASRQFDRQPWTQSTLGRASFSTTSNHEKEAIRGRRRRSIPRELRRSKGKDANTLDALRAHLLAEEEDTGKGPLDDTIEGVVGKPLQKLKSKSKPQSKPKAKKSKNQTTEPTPFKDEDIKTEQPTGPTKVKAVKSKAASSKRAKPVSVTGSVTKKESVNGKETEPKAAKRKDAAKTSVKSKDTGSKSAVVRRILQSKAISPGKQEKRHEKPTADNDDRLESRKRNSLALIRAALLKGDLSSLRKINIKDLAKEIDQSKDEVKKVHHKSSSTDK